MSPDLQHTLARAASIRGVAIHSGETVCLVVHPAAANAGIRFLRQPCEAGSGLIEARVGAVSQTRLGTVIANLEGVAVSTVEHLMAALSALSIDNALVTIDGGEVPIMDGSAEPFVSALDLAGRRPQHAPRRYIEVLQTVEVAKGESYARLIPADGFEVAFDIEFPSRAIGHQSLDLEMDEAAFRRELADCRTFGFADEAESLRAAGLARGGSLENVVVIEGDQIVNPGGLRRSDEFVRHKALDAVGDLYLLGRPLIARYESRLGGHGLNNALCRALLATPRAWRLAAAPNRLARAG
ncbi:MAG: UDP-3-O-acyl-N-acetylglucosamine deacetylase [Caulobacteraceae bacterium]